MASEGDHWALIADCFAHGYLQGCADGLYLRGCQGMSGDVMGC